MALSYKTRRRLSLILLLIWLPAYIVLVVTLLNMIERLPFIIELFIYVILGVAWALPFKFVFKGVGKDIPKEERKE